MGRLMAIQEMTFLVAARSRMHGSKPGGRLLHTFLTTIVTITESITSFAQRVTCSLQNTNTNTIILILQLEFSVSHHINKRNRRSMK